MRRTSFTVVAALQLLPAAPGGVIACTAGDSESASRPFATDSAPREQIPLRVCEDAPAPAAVATEHWRHFSSRFVTWAAPWHSGEDIVTVTGEGATLRAKIAYGTLGKDLEDEWVEVWIDRCDGLELVDVVRTDSDGRVAVPLKGSALAGRHRVHFRVAGDGTQTQSTLYVLPSGARIGVFDIDGTLTTSDWELFEDLADDLFAPIHHGEAPDAREGATAITQARADQGYVILYLTGRPYWLTQRTRDWLEDREMASGALVTAQRSKDVLPLESGVGAYKADVLAELELLGLTIDFAYGNAATDVFAYDEAGIDASATFILGRHGGENGTVALGESFADHLDEESFAAIEQPFAIVE